MRFAMAVTTTMTTLAASLAAAQPVRDRHEAADDRREERKDRRQLAEDKLDAARAAAMFREYEAASAVADFRRMGALDEAFKRYVAQEIAEARAAAHHARREARRDEARLERDERVDPRDAHRDRSELADDRGDVRAARLSAERLEAIQNQLWHLAGRFDPPSVDQKRRLYGELVGRAMEDVHRDRHELREDHRELRDDARGGRRY